MPSLVVVDTNVVVSGLISESQESPPCQIVDRMLDGGFSFLLSLDLLAEYRRVLLRPRIQKLHGLTEEEIDTILTTMTANGIVRDTQPAKTTESDPGDQHLEGLMSVHSETILVTGDIPLKKVLQKKFLVLSPQEFVTQELHPR